MLVLPSELGKAINFLILKASLETIHPMIERDNDLLISHYFPFSQALMGKILRAYKHNGAKKIRYSTEL